MCACKSEEWEFTSIQVFMNRPSSKSTNAWHDRLGNTRTTAVVLFITVLGVLLSRDNRNASAVDYNAVHRCHSEHVFPFWFPESPNSAHHPKSPIRWKRKQPTTPSDRCDLLRSANMNATLVLFGLGCSALSFHKTRVPRSRR